tara:strand:- start:17530 stop:18411 length:882 start_codon:yes stop_codon:yes gene_type:complete
MAFPKLAELQATIGDTAASPAAPEVPASPAVDAAPATESPTPEPSSDSPEPASLDESSSETPAEAKADAPGPIPYDRFKQKNEEAKHLKDLNGTLQERIKQLEAGQPAPQVDQEPPETSEFLGKIKDLAERSGDEDVAGALVAMGEQLETIRAQSDTARQDTQQMQIQKLVDEYNHKIKNALDGSSVHDAPSARHYVLQVLNKNPDADIGATVQTFIEHERKLEDQVLKRLGVTRPEATKEAAAPDPALSLPTRGKVSSGTAPIADGAPAPSKKPMTLRAMKSSLYSGRRRPR